MTTEDDEKAWIDAIRWTALRNMNKARERFEETFGVSVTDKSINAEFLRLFDHACDDNESTVTIPIRLAFAITLRDGGKGKGKNRERPAFVRRAQILATRHAERLFAEKKEQAKRGPVKRRDKKKSALDLRREAAVEALNKYPLAKSWTVETLMGRMRTREKKSR